MRAGATARGSRPGPARVGPALAAVVALVAAFVGGWPAPARAELLGTVATPVGSVRLMTDPCRLEQPRGDADAKRAYRLRGGSPLEGCWIVNDRGDPVVTWSGGQRQTLDGSRVRLQRKYAVLLEDLPQRGAEKAGADKAGSTTSRTPTARGKESPPRETSRARTTPEGTTSRPVTPERRVAQGAGDPDRSSTTPRSPDRAGTSGTSGTPGTTGPSRPTRPAANAANAANESTAAFDRPGWCRSAKLLPHERRVCTDRTLAAQDLALAPLWRAFRRQERLTPAAEAWHKSDFFGRLKACGANDACISREQLARRRFYEDALARADQPGPPRTRP